MFPANFLKTQFEFEIETWKRLLVFLSEENNNAKNRLSDIVKDIGNNDEELIERVENFHNRMLKGDEILGLLYREMLEQQSLISKTNGVNEYQTEVKSKQQDLRNGLKKVKNNFLELNAEFNNWLSEVL